MFDWEEYLKLANELSFTPNAPPACREAKQRCSISRAYYSVFVTARNHLRDIHGVTLPSEKVHSFVRYKFKRPPRKGSGRNTRNYARIGVLLGRLYDNRGKADYDDVITNCDGLNTASLQEARQAFSIFEIIRIANPSDLPDYS